jgi:hypothetical protein
VLFSFALRPAFFLPKLLCQIRDFLLRRNWIGLAAGNSDAGSFAVPARILAERIVDCFIGWNRRIGRVTTA